jgi:hypothetical protein
MSEVRKCIYCGQQDDHPKHETIHPGFISVYAHKDCCAEVTGCVLCTPDVEAADGRRGAEFREFLESLR